MAVQAQAQPQYPGTKQPQKKGKDKSKIQEGVKISSAADGRRIGRWFIGETLGKGGYSWVKKGIDRKNGRIVALKFMERRLTSNGEWKKSQQQQIKNEIETLKCLRHENIIRLLAYNLNAKYPDRNKQSRDVILLVLEYAAGGELFDILYYTEKLEPILARTYFRQLVAGISCMHKNGIIHRDIKPQNLLLDNKYNLKITDFGLSKIDPTGNSNIKMNDWHVGTRGYQAPEILLRKKDYDKKVDVFAMGVVLFILLGGYPPFEHAKESDKWYQFIVNKKYKNFWKSHRNCGLRQQETDLITRMICFDPDKRISLEKIRKHSWFTNKEILSNENLIKVLRYRHVKMEQQRNNDPNKQKILQHSMKRPVKPAILKTIEEANKDEYFMQSRDPELEVEDEDGMKSFINQQRWHDIGQKKSENKYALTDKSEPPLLPDNEIINPQDVYTSGTLTAFEVLQGLEAAITEHLKGVPQKPDYNELVDFEAGKAESNKDEAKTNEDDFDGTYIDVRNFSLVFKVALQDLDDNLMTTDSLLIHLGLYSVKVTEGTYCKLVKFTRLRGDREPFIKVIQELGKAAGQFLAGIDKDAQKAMKAGEKEQDEAFQQLYKACFPDENQQSQEQQAQEV